MTQKACLSPNALRLLGRLHRHRIVIGLDRLRYDCRGQFDQQDPVDVADELVVAGYFDTFVNNGERKWVRTQKPYTDKMRRKLAAYAQRKNEVEHGKVLSRPRADVDAGVAAWFGYPTHVTRLVGRVHLMEGGTDD